MNPKNRERLSSSPPSKSSYLLIYNPCISLNLVTALDKTQWNHWLKGSGNKKVFPDVVENGWND